VRRARRLLLRLYVAGNAPNSRLAIANINDMCGKHFTSGYDLEIVDMLQNPLRALADQIIVTPTLLKIAPSPRERMIGNLSNTEQVLLTLGAK
jgi:circadian clock protein KaiB